MADITGIINQARRELGISRRVTAPEEAPDYLEAYQNFRVKLLRDHIWKFAKETVRLARLSEAPPAGWRYAYQLPSDWLRTMEVYDNQAMLGHEIPYERFGRTIRTYTEECYIVYIRDITDPNEMDPNFLDALALRIAWHLALKETNSNTVKAEMRSDYRREMSKARSNDAMEQPAAPQPAGSWTYSRQSWGNTTRHGRR